MDKLAKLKKMKLPELLNVDLTRLNTPETEYVEKRLLRVAKTRVKALKADKTARLSPALSRHDTKLQSTRSVLKKRKSPVKNVRAKMVHNIVGLVSLLKDKDSTVKGATDTVNGLKRLVNKVAGTEKGMNDRQLKRFFRLWDKARELYGGENVPDINKKGGSPVWKRLIELVTSNKYIKNDEILDEINKTITADYERKQALLAELEDEEAEMLDLYEDEVEDDEEDYDVF